MKRLALGTAGDSDRPKDVGDRHSVVFQERMAMILKQSVVVSLIALALSGCASTQTAASRFGPSGPTVEQGLSTPNLDDAVTQGIQSGDVDRALGGR
jgi:hypothetical protein